MSKFSQETTLSYGTFVQWRGPELLLETADVDCNTVSPRYDIVFPIQKEALLGLDDILENFKQFDLMPVKDTIWVKPAVGMEIFPDPNVMIVPGKMKFRLQIIGLFRANMDWRWSVCFKARQVYMYPPIILEPLKPSK